jgi:hypothetical protein
MPSDEEVKEFCLATGGGFGFVDPTEKIFFVGGTMPKAYVNEHLTKSIPMAGK